MVARPLADQTGKVDPCSLLTRDEVQRATGKSN